jgi:hypothetical protein
MSAAIAVTHGPSDQRELHLTIRSLCLAIAVMESTPNEYRAESDMLDWEGMLKRVAPCESMREFYRTGAWRTLASLTARKDVEQ